MESRLREAVTQSAEHEDVLSSEDRFQELLATELGDCERELRMVFDPPSILPMNPSTADLTELGNRGKDFPPGGKDPCSGSVRKLDLLWNTDHGLIPIELKAVAERQVDAYSYYFLKDLHRLERLREVEGNDSISSRRFAIFLTKASEYWSHSTPEPEVFRLSHGRSLPRRWWVQFTQDSPVTRWVGDYPPFHLARGYRFEWTDLGNGMRYLLTEVEKVPLTPR